MSKPKTPKVDYKGMWRNYSRWTRDQSGRHAEARSFEEARMARAGLKRDTPAWMENLANLQKSQDAERKKLMGGSTASELKDRTKRSMRLYGMGRGVPADFDVAADRMKEATRSYESDVRTVKNRFRIDEGGGYRIGYNRAIRGVESIEDRVTRLTAQDEKDAREGNYFSSERRSIGHSDAGERYISVAGMTRAGRMEYSRLRTETDSEFGRPLKGWEAFARMSWGGVGEEQMSAEEESMQTAKKAAGGQRSSTEAAAAEQAAEAGGGSSNSPWIRKKAENQMML